MKTSLRKAPSTGASMVQSTKRVFASQMVRLHCDAWLGTYLSPMNGASHRISKTWSAAAGEKHKGVFSPFFHCSVEGIIRLIDITQLAESLQSNAIKPSVSHEDMLRGKDLGGHGSGRRNAFLPATDRVRRRSKNNKEAKHDDGKDGAGNAAREKRRVRPVKGCMRNCARERRTSGRFCWRTDQSVSMMDRAITS